MAALQGMQDAGLPPTAVLCNKVITALGKAGMLAAAHDLFQQMRGTAASKVRTYVLWPVQPVYARMDVIGRLCEGLSMPVLLSPHRQGRHQVLVCMRATSGTHGVDLEIVLVYSCPS